MSSNTVSVFRVSVMTSILCLDCSAVLRSFNIESIRRRCSYNHTIVHTDLGSSALYAIQDHAHHNLQIFSFPRLAQHDSPYGFVVYTLLSLLLSVLIRSRIKPLSLWPLESYLQ
ncbi:hypothetical protein BKA67DRAFT_543197 [Truncatella angustata]|uniref:Uncharacterized protein n=1 Tax=Truncatella angustata TaxID=152316 RepID=A0A9P8UVB7_9PEZI|nr:uncharacterized protein BKA67DRAFT_543197 [Truncatella angustata]KAH6659005.1 hypothetical protein BKA67DRAFT_543197 [Truncatella angustata]